MAIEELEHNKDLFGKRLLADLKIIQATLAGLDKGSLIHRSP
jgi:hypothetical protein